MEPLVLAFKPSFITRISFASLAFAGTALAASSVQLSEDDRFFLDLNCYECHNDVETEGGLDLEHLEFKPNDPASLKLWELIHDRIQDDEMPPRDELQPEKDEEAAFLKSMENTLHTISAEKIERNGRVRSRRLNRIEYENTLHDLLGIDIPLQTYLPEDPAQDGFTNVAEAQQISYHLLEKYLEAADAALDESFQRALSPARLKTRSFQSSEIASGRNRVGNDRQPFLIGEHAVSYPTGLSYHGRMRETKATESGWYRISFTAHAVNPPEGRGVWASVRSGFCYAVAPLMYWIGSFEAREEPETFTYEAWIQEEHMLEIRPTDSTLPRISGRAINVDCNAPDLNAPGVAFKDLTIERIYKGPSPKALRSQLFGSLRFENGDFVSAQPTKDIAQQIERFANRAFRQPIDQAELAPYIAFANDAYDTSKSIQSALRAGYRAILCSPRFLYFNESLGRLDPYAIASRLSYFLWSTLPDDTLLELAKSGQLARPEVIRQQVDRLLEDPRSQAFIEGFAAHWLNLREIDMTTPDEKLYREFDEILKNAMLGETHAFLERMVKEDLSISNVIDSDFAMLNERLARHYGIEGVSGTEIRPVALKPEHHRGGIITHGSILKITANGTTSSPVIRGVWMLERILGERIPSPPDVPAVEPDIRGATSIREQLDKHRNSSACSPCHIKIDPSGFALENYDVIGGWRTHYRALQGKKGPKVDAHYELPTGERFEDITGFKEMVLQKPENIARNLLDKTLIYATGASIEFADRREIDALVEKLESSDYGFRSLIHAATQSSIFLSK